MVLPPYVYPGDERETLAQLLHNLQRNGQAGLALLEGEAGVGKSHFIEDLRHQALNMVLPVFVGAGEALERGAYTAWRGVFAEMLGLTAVANAATRQERVLTYLQALEIGRAHV